ncbi:hypothetical protein MRX96_041786 [Rhipicephalus microplus]
MMELVGKLKALRIRVEMPSITASEDDRKLMQRLQRLQAITAQAPYVRFIEGSKSSPAKGDSSEAVTLLQEAGLEFQHFDVATDSVLRQRKALLHTTNAFEKVARSPALIRKLAEKEGIAPTDVAKGLRRRLRSVDGLYDFMRLAGGVKKCVKCVAPPVDDHGMQL